MSVKVHSAVSADVAVANAVAVRVNGADKHTVSAVWTPTNTTAMVIYLYGTNQGKAAVDAGTATWHIMTTHTTDAGGITAGYTMFHTVDKPVEFIKVAIDLTTTGTPALSAWYSGYRGDMRIA